MGPAAIQLVACIRVSSVPRIMRDVMRGISFLQLDDAIRRDLLIRAHVSDYLSHPERLVWVLVVEVGDEVIVLSLVGAVELTIVPMIRHHVHVLTRSIHHYDTQMTTHDKELQQHQIHTLRHSSVGGLTVALASVCEFCSLTETQLIQDMTYNRTRHTLNSIAHSHHRSPTDLVEKGSDVLVKELGELGRLHVSVRVHRFVEALQEINVHAYDGGGDDSCVLVLGM